MVVKFIWFKCVSRDDNMGMVEIKGTKCLKDDRKRLADALKNAPKSHEQSITENKIHFEQRLQRVVKDKNISDLEKQRKTKRIREEEKAQFKKLQENHRAVIEKGERDLARLDTTIKKLEDARFGKSPKKNLFGR